MTMTSPSLTFGGHRTLALVWILSLALHAPSLAKDPARPHQTPPDPARPNILIMVADDLGYGDLGCYGNQTLATPHLDRLASEGVRLTHSLAAYATCTPSRAALMTGRYPVRSGMLPYTNFPVFTVTAATCGLPVSEVTLGDVAKAAGYKTAYIGKWHLGWSVNRQDPEHPHPLNNGFDYFYGLPLTNTPDFDDQPSIFITMNPNAPVVMATTFALALVTVTTLVHRKYMAWWFGLWMVASLASLMGYFVLYVLNVKLLNSFLYRNYDLVEQPVDLTTFTRKLVLEGQQFLQARQSDGSPFLLMVGWQHVHTAVVSGPRFAGKSPHGPYGDGVQELDWAVGQLLDTLRSLGQDNDTLVYFTSDHGASPVERDSQGRVVGGSNGQFWGSKGDGGTEGALRVPTLVRWPARFPAGRVLHEPVSHLDLLPTVADLLGEPLTPPAGTGGDVADHVTTDGRSLVALLSGRETVSLHEFLFHYCLGSVHAVRYRPRTGNKVWKLALREPPREIDGDPHFPVISRCAAAVVLDPPRLYDLTADPTASSPLKEDPAAQQPEVRAAMMAALEAHARNVGNVSMPYQFALHRVLWRPWLQACCGGPFPHCQCRDEKFADLFKDS